MTTPTSNLDLSRFLDDAQGLVDFVRGVCRRLNISVSSGDSMPTVSVNVFSAIGDNGRELSRLRSDQAEARGVRVRYEDFLQWLAEDFGIHLPRVVGELDLSGFKERVQAEIHRRSERELRGALCDVASAVDVPDTAPSIGALKANALAAIRDLKARPSVQDGADTFRPSPCAPTLSEPGAEVPRHRFRAEYGPGRSTPGVRDGPCEPRGHCEPLRSRPHDRGG